VALLIPAHTLLCHVYIYDGKHKTSEAVQCGLAVCVFVSLILTNQTDPGTVPISPTDLKEDFRHGERRGDATWCGHCVLWRPKHAAHCNTCERCFFDHDHHCGVMGTCIAQHNIRFFNIFCLTVSLATFFATAVGMLRIWALWDESPGYTYNFFRTCFLVLGVAPMYAGTAWLCGCPCPCLRYTTYGSGRESTATLLDMSYVKCGNFRCVIGNVDL
jgi:hypothetical protein